MVPWLRKGDFLSLHYQIHSLKYTSADRSTIRFTHLAYKLHVGETIRKRSRKGLDREPAQCGRPNQGKKEATQKWDRMGRRSLTDNNIDKIIFHG